MRRRTLILLAAATFLFGVAPSVKADSAPDRVSLISHRLHTLWMAGVPDVARFAIVEAQFGIRVLSAPADFEAQDINNDVIEVPRPTVWYDSFSEYPYGVSASFRWRYICGRNRNEACWLDYGGRSGDGNSPVGGDDGFALQIDKPVKTKGGGLTLKPNCNDKQLFYVQPSTMTDYGVGYHRPDTVDYDPRHCGDKSDNREYNWDSGEIATNFAIGRRCETQRIFVASKFGHTWQKTNITGFGISVDGISIQWENEGQNFEAFPNEQGYYDCHF